MGIIYTHFRYKEPVVEVQPCTIERVVELPAWRYANFCHSLTDSQDFIEECARDLYKDSSGINHCLLVLGAGTQDGILVRSEGYGWARYHAYLPDARKLLDMERYPVLDQYTREAAALVDEYVQTAITNQQQGCYRIPLDSIYSRASSSFGFQPELIAQMLRERPELNSVIEEENNLCLEVNPEFAMAEEQEEHVQGLTL